MATELGTILEGQVTAVDQTAVGTALTQDAAVNDTVLHVEDVSAFNEGGGQLKLPDGTAASYSSVDKDAETITLSSGLSSAFSSGDLISVYPTVINRWATVTIPGYLDPIVAEVPFSIAKVLPLGQRTENAAETVLVVESQNGWVITDVLAEPNFDAIKGGGPGITPDAPGVPTLTFDTTERYHHQKWRCKVSWSPVTTPTNVNIDHYVLLFQKSEDGLSWTEPPRRVVVPAAVGDPDETSNHYIFHQIRKNRFYRAKVRAVSIDGLRSNFSPWSAGDSPSTDAPTAPSNVTIDSAAVDRISFSWAVADNSKDPDLIDDRPAYFQAALMMNTTNAPTVSTAYRIDRYCHTTNRAFRVASADRNQTFYAWVRSVDGDGDKSAWIPATTAGNSNPAATPEGVQLGGVIRHKWWWHGQLQTLQEADSDDLEIDTDSVLFRVRGRVKVAPLGGPIKFTLYQNGVAIKQFTIPAGQYRVADDTLNTPFVSGDKISISIDQVGNVNPGARLTVLCVWK